MLPETALSWRWLRVRPSLKWQKSGLEALELKALERSLQLPTKTIE